MSNAIDIIMDAFSREGANPQVIRDEHGIYAVSIDGAGVVHVAASGPDRIELFAVIHADTDREPSSTGLPLDWFTSEIRDPPFDWRLGVHPGTSMALLCASANATALDAVTFATGMATFVERMQQYASVSTSTS